jgi:hypothetical protein
MQTLVSRCLENDDAEAWCELWLLYEESAAAPLRSLLLNRGFSAEDAEDLLMSLACELFLDDAPKLRSFCGTAKAQLGCWFARVAANYARNWTVQQWRRPAEVPQDSVTYEPASRRGLTQRQAKLLLDELDELAELPEYDITTADMQHLRVLLGFETSPSEIPERTLRHWKQSLREKLPRLFDEDEL